MNSTTLASLGPNAAVVPASPGFGNRRERPHWGKTVRTGSSRITIVGLLASVVFVGGFGVWASVVPLAGATVSHGYIAASGRNVQIQHLEGGIIDRIEVAEGDVVRTGQTLFRFDATEPTALRNRLFNQLFALRARAARLAAQRGNKPLVFPANLRVQNGDPVLAAVLTEQKAEFDTKLEGYRREQAILDQQIVGLSQEVAGIAEQKAATEQQLAVVSEELVRRKNLLDKGLANRRDYTDFLISQAQLTGQISQLTASSLTSTTRIAEKREQLARMTSQRTEDASAELNDVRTKISDVEEQLAAAGEVLDRVAVRSPTTGVIVKLNYNAVGAVVASGQPLAEILPTSENLIVETRLAPQDIDAVHISQTASLRFTALNRLTPTVDAQVVYVSPDRLIDPRTDQPYYTARLRITDELPASIERSQIYPGMPVETYIRTGDRTFMEYLLKPLQDSFSRAFRER